MSLQGDLRIRAKDKCELCEAEGHLQPYGVAPYEDEEPEHHVLICDGCFSQLEDRDGGLDAHHWFGLQGAIWSEVPAVQVMSYRILGWLRGEGWARDLLDQAYLAEEVLEWARQGQAEEDGEASPRTLDSHGTELNDGDSVTLVKDLDVKGASFVAKRGTVVKDIRLTGDPEFVEGKVNRIMIVLKTDFLKKA